MIQLKKISQYKYLIIAILCVIYSLIINNYVDIKSKYDINDNTITGYINNYNIDGNKISIELIGKEKIICTYYFKTEEELNKFKNTYKYGDVIEITGVINVPSNNTVFNLFNYKSYLKYEGINYIFKIDTINKLKDNNKLRYKIKNKIIELVEKNINKDYLYTFILGNNKYIDSNAMSSYRINGISHLFAISGMHVSLLSIILLKILDKFKYKNVVIILVLIFYMFLTDFTPSIMRAGIMFILIYVNKKFKFKIKTIDLMYILLSILIVIDPYIIYKVGFQYSYIISFFLIYFNEIIKNSKNKIDSLFKISLISFMASLPITINNFFSINILSIALNIFFVPIISSIIFPLALITLVVPIFSNILNILINIFEYLSIFFSKIDILIFTTSKMNIVVTILYYVVIIYIIYGIKKNNYSRILILVFILIMHLNTARFNENSEITFIDVGQGDSILIKMPYDKSNILIDTGGVENYNNELWSIKNNNYSIGKDKIVMYLKSIGINRLDYLILTHGDTDHVGESIDIIESIRVDKVIFNYGKVNDNEKQIIDVLNKKKISYYFYNSNNSIDLYKYKLIFISPNEEYDNENDNSLVTYLDIDNFKFLFTGDISNKVENSIINKYDLNVDVLKVGHHGSKTSSSYEFLNKLKPTYSVVSVGLNNKFNHPALSVVNNIKNVNSIIYRTDYNGSIKFKIKNNKLEIETCVP